jgi:hypothetical protein
MTEPIRIILEGGLIQEIRNIPDGVTIEVFDYDVEGSGRDHPNVIKDEQGEYVFHNIYDRSGQIK